MTNLVVLNYSVQYPHETAVFLIHLIILCVQDVHVAPSLLVSKQLNNSNSHKLKSHMLEFISFFGSRLVCHIKKHTSHS